LALALALVLALVKALAIDKKIIHQNFCGHNENIGSRIGFNVPSHEPKRNMWIFRRKFIILLV
jgi:hypothetical protein